MNSSAMMPVFVCVGPAAGLIGFVLVMLGISSRQPKMWKWGLGVLILDALILLGAFIQAGMHAR